MSISSILRAGVAIVVLQFFNATTLCVEPVGVKPSLDPAKFATPPIEYRPIDCWWWEAGKLTEERLKWQIEEMHDKGVGGTWLYPRFGTEHPMSSDPGFWTEGWWEFVRFALDEHQRLGMVQFANDWLGRLDKAHFQNLLRAEGKQNPKLVGRRLVAHQTRSVAAEKLTIAIPQGEEILSAAAYHLREASESSVDGDSYVDLTDFIDGQILAWDAPGPEWLAVVVTSQPHDLDYLGSEVASRWIEIFFAKYQEQLGNRLGKSLVAYGPDERYVLNGNILYSDELRSRYEQQEGADYLADLPALFIDIGPQTDRVRCQYYKVMNDLLEENLYEPFANWLHERGMKQVTIATWGRENLLGQTQNYGDFPRMMKHFDIPGNEDSKESGPMGAFIDTKMSSSMAHLNGRSRVAVCAYWGMGWGYTQAENVARTNFNYALGINLYNTHGVLYSLLAGRNEFVPPEVHFYQPYWKTWRSFTDYVSRLSYVLSQGQHRSDVALLYPLSTIHANWHNGSKFERPADDAQQSTLALAKALFADSLDFNFVDEARLAAATIESEKIRIAALEFQVVVLPATTTLPLKVMARLREFVLGGGTLLVFRQPPTASADFGRDDPNLLTAWQELLGNYEASSEPIVVHHNDGGGKTILVRTTEQEAVAALREEIQPDVTTSDRDLAHIHRQISGQHIYYFVNRRPKSRTINATVRCQGRPEVWDARTGETRPLYRFQTVGSCTELRLEMAPYEGVLVVFHPEEAAPQLLQDNLVDVESIERKGENVEVTGTADGSEELHATVLLNNRRFAGRIAPVLVPSSIALDGIWECEYHPTMDNRWGDYRYPASNELIGPEIHRLKYRAEPDSVRQRPNWQAAGFNDDDWESVNCTFGPYWHVLGPIDVQLDSEELRELVLDLADRATNSIEVAGEAFQWQPYSYSWKFGANRNDVHQSGSDGLGPVSPDFFVFDAPRGGKPTVRYLKTRVFSPRNQRLFFDFGGRTKEPDRQAWINGVQIEGIENIALQEGWNQIVLRIVQPNSRQLATFAVFHKERDTPRQPRFMPISRWYDESQSLIYDCQPEGRLSVGWFRFLVPPAARVAKLNLIAKSVEAWVDGEPVEVIEDKIQLPETDRNDSTIALRVTHKPGYYEGAAFQGPISFELGRGQIPLGDWSQFGLETYSGGLNYVRHVSLSEKQLANQLVLDLGEIRTSAEVKINGHSLGVRLAPPYVFDVSEAVKAGDNKIEVEVLNTLANYMSGGPSKYVYEGQTVSGLLGPVNLRLIPRVRIECQPVTSDPPTTVGGER